MEVNGDRGVGDQGGEPPPAPRPAPEVPDEKKQNLRRVAGISLGVAAFLALALTPNALHALPGQGSRPAYAAGVTRLIPPDHVRLREREPDRREREPEGPVAKIRQGAVVLRVGHTLPIGARHVGLEGSNSAQSLVTR